MRYALSEGCNNLSLQVFQTKTARENLGSYGVKMARHLHSSNQFSDPSILIFSSVSIASSLPKRERLEADEKHREQQDHPRKCGLGHLHRLDPVAFSCR